MRCTYRKKLAVSLAASLLFGAGSVLAQATQQFEEIKLGFDSLCNMKVTPEGDVYAIGQSKDGKRLAYAVFKDDLKTVYKGDLQDPAGRPLICNFPGLGIIPGLHDDFFVSLYLNDGSAGGTIFNVKLKEDKKIKSVFYKDDIFFSHVSFDEMMSTLYVGTYPYYHGHDETISAIDMMPPNAVNWSKSFPRVRIFEKPDKSALYLVDWDKKANLLSLKDGKVVPSGVSLLGGSLRSRADIFIDKNGDVYNINGINDKENGALLKARPFSDRPEEVWRLPVENSGDYTALSLASNGFLYVSSYSWERGTGVRIVDAKKGGKGTFIPFPFKLKGIQKFDTPVAFDPSTGKGYAYLSSFIASASANSPENSKDQHVIWQFSPETNKSALIFDRETPAFTDANKLDKVKLIGLQLVKGRLFFGLGGTLYIYTDDDGASPNQNWVDIGIDYHGHSLVHNNSYYYKVRWKVRDEHGEIQQQGEKRFNTDNPNAREGWFVTGRVAEGINAQSGPLKMGVKQTNGEILHLDSVYRNRLWLPSNLKEKGWTVEVTPVELDQNDPLPKPIWELNPVSGFDAIRLKEGEAALSSAVCLKVEGLAKAIKQMTLSPLRTENVYQWAYDLSTAISLSAQSRNHLYSAGELNETQIKPLYSSYRNLLWVQKDSGVSLSYEQGECP